MQVFVLVQKMLFRIGLSRLSTVQVAPPSLLFMNLPLSPTAKMFRLSSRNTPFRLFPCGHGFCHTQPEVALIVCADTGTAATIRKHAQHSTLILNMIRSSEWIAEIRTSRSTLLPSSGMTSTFRSVYTGSPFEITRRSVRCDLRDLAV